MPLLSVQLYIFLPLLGFSSFAVTTGVSIEGAKSFSSAIKGGNLKANETNLLFETNEGPGFFTEMWFTGALQDSSTVIRIYMDGDMEKPALEFNLYLAHGIGCNGVQEDGATPWHTTHFGHEATSGGLYNTYRIPFGSGGVKVTATNTKGGMYWFIARGLLNTPLVVDGFTLPNKTRLSLYRQDNVHLQPLEFLTMADIKSHSGWIYQVTIDANSSSYRYLEACFRLNIDGGETEFLSSGTEDFFLSAYYFNRGPYRADQSGLSCKNSPGQISAYKFFASDPLFFSKSALLQWRCGETPDGVKGCPSKAHVFRTRRDLGPESLLQQISGPSPTNVTTYTWVYEY